MKETPIIFTSESVRAILDGRKTQTRRVIKPQPLGKPYWADGTTDSIRGGKIIGDAGYYDGGYSHHKYIKCPSGQVGDRLWVKETWATEKRIDRFSPSYIGNAGDVPLWYKHDPRIITDYVERGKWRPSIFMPRWASRITLEITEVRVERLQEITAWDIASEGVKPIEDYFAPIMFIRDWHTPFAKLWDSLNAKRGYGWEINPWVWVISFATGVRLK